MTSQIDIGELCESIRGTLKVTDNAVIKVPRCDLQRLVDAVEAPHPLPIALVNIFAERRRQIEDERFDERHDDSYRNEELAAAAACYAAPEPIFVQFKAEGATGTFGAFKELWPWNWQWWKRKDRRRDLVRAGALIVAAIEKIDRAALRKAGGAA